MRFRFPSLGPDTVSAEQVRAVREAQGWTVEQMADVVHASPLEVSTWEAGAVRVPPEQTERIRWYIDMDEWNAAVARVRGEPCAWVRQHVPHLYEIMFIDVAGITWYSQSAEIRVHLARCATCQATWRQAERLGGRPREPDDAPDTWRTRYRRWAKRFPRWLGTPLCLLGELSGLAVVTVAVLTIPDPDSGLPAHVYGLGMGTGIGWLAFGAAGAGLRGLSRRHPRLGGVLAGIAGSLAGFVWWSFVDAAANVRDPRLWAASAAVGVALGLIHARMAQDAADREPPVLAPADAERAALPGSRPGLDLGVRASAIRDVENVK
jgi:hypothetical protein